MLGLGIASTLAVAAAGSLGYATRGRSSSLFGPNIWRGPRGSKRITFTFDDGPSESTPEILELLSTLGVRATFFQCGKNVERLPALACQVRDLGHEIGNHTYSHPRLPFCPPVGIRQEVSDAQTAIQHATGVAPRLFRAPYGWRWFGLRRVLVEFNLTGVMWTVIAHDWDWGAEEIADHVLARASSGGIICMHDGDRTSPDANRRNTAAALRKIIPALYDRGYSFVTAGEVLEQLRSRHTYPAPTRSSILPG